MIQQISPKDERIVRKTSKQEVRFQITMSLYKLTKGRKTDNTTTNMDSVKTLYTDSSFPVDSILEIHIKQLWPIT